MNDKLLNHNHLIKEKSPYLLQHSKNPVDWYPWSEEAFSKARKEEKPIFLSIGYSACHWCQVMESESFEDKEVAGFLNENFVSVKVDREERPDIDNIYMTVCQSMTGSGGWPLTIIITPDKRPFFSGTYFPKHTKYGRPGLMDILPQILSLWKNDRDRLLTVSKNITRAIQNYSFASKKTESFDEILQSAFQHLKDTFDESYGGFGTAPKFPTPHILSFLLRRWNTTNDTDGLEMVKKTLDMMAHGGIYDHLGFGFHRYSTDRKWFVPHFEKMIYDQALISLPYLETYQITQEKKYADISRQIFTYVLRDMTSPDGGFYTAENADSEGEEGKFYIWTKKEVIEILGEKKGEIFCQFYDISSDGNFENKNNILATHASPDEFAHDNDINVNVGKKTLEESRKTLFTVRNQRIHPSKDDKILTDWNGLMIVSLSRGARILNNPTYSDFAQRAAHFILKHLRREDGRLLHRYRDGHADISGFLDDYAFFIWGLIELYETTFDIQYLREAIDLCNDMIELFWDEKEHGFFMTGKDSEKHILRMKKFHDGAIPSGNAVAAIDLLLISRFTSNEDYEEKANQIIESIGGRISESSTGFAHFLIAIDLLSHSSNEIVLAGTEDNEHTNEMVQSIRRGFLPHTIVMLHPPGIEGELVEKILPSVKHKEMIDDKTTAYVCTDSSCKPPTINVKEMLSLVQTNRKKTHKISPCE